MKIGIVSDTHSNLYALQSVLEHMNSVGVDRKVHLGNIVGNGPKPSETLNLTLSEFNYITTGKLDLAVAYENERYGLTPQEQFAVDWTGEQLSSEEISLLKNFAISHLAGDMLFSRDNKKGFLEDFQVSFVGDTVIPSVNFLHGHTKAEFLKSPLHMSGYTTNLHGHRAIINVGSVGAPRDGDPRACYVIYDTETDVVTFYRIPYDVERTVGQMQRAGFASGAWQRLMYGN